MLADRDFIVEDPAPLHWDGVLDLVVPSCEDTYEGHLLESVTDGMCWCRRCGATLGVVQPEPVGVL